MTTVKYLPRSRFMMPIMVLSSISSSPTQERIFAFLGDPARHPGVVRVDTHGAAVFLDGRRALKVKRAIRFPFLDYSTLEKRKAACEEEIRINQPMAPQIYQGVVAITQREDGSFQVGGDGPPVEFAVQMTRFDENRTLDHIVNTHELSMETATGIADAIMASHALAPRPSAPRWIDGLPAIIDANTAGLKRHGVLELTDIEKLAEACYRAYARIRPLLAERANRGFVRRCHGDLHLGNIVLIADKPVLFDAIEFDPAIATIDVLYDLSFTLMDLLRYGQSGAANTLFNRYLTSSEDENLDALSALPLFMSVRAAIRAQVLLARSTQTDAEQRAVCGNARAYFHLAQALIAPGPPRLIAIGGLSGTGKSMMARMLAPMVLPPPGAVVLRSDLIRKRLFNVKEADRLPQWAYRAEVSDRVYKNLINRAERVLAQGHSAIVDAVFAHKSERDDILALARRQKTPALGMFLTASLRTRQQRIASRRNDASDATQEVAAEQESYNIGEVDWTTIDASGTPEETFNLCRKLIAADEHSEQCGDPSDC